MESQGVRIFILAGGCCGPQRHLPSATAAWDTSQAPERETSFCKVCHFQRVQETHTHGKDRASQGFLKIRTKPDFQTTKARPALTATVWGRSGKTQSGETDPRKQAEMDARVWIIKWLIDHCLWGQPGGFFLTHFFFLLVFLTTMFSLPSALSKARSPGPWLS